MVVSTLVYIYFSAAASLLTSSSEQGKSITQQCYQEVLHYYVVHSNIWLLGHQHKNVWGTIKFTKTTKCSRFRQTRLTGFSPSGLACAKKNRINLLSGKQHQNGFAEIADRFVVFVNSMVPLSLNTILY